MNTIIALCATGLAFYRLGLFIGKWRERGRVADVWNLYAHSLKQAFAAREDGSIGQLSLELLTYTVLHEMVSGEKPSEGDSCP